jgi:hypothetical protein
MTTEPREVQRILLCGPEVRVAAWSPEVNGRTMDWSRIVQTTTRPIRSLSLRIHPMGLGYSPYLALSKLGSVHVVSPQTYARWYITLF